MKDVEFTESLQQAAQVYDPVLLASKKFAFDKNARFSNYGLLYYTIVSIVLIFIYTLRHNSYFSFLCK